MLLILLLPEAALNHLYVSKAVISTPPDTSWKQQVIQFRSVIVSV
jgi:hypothetical protein